MVTEQRVIHDVTVFLAIQVYAVRQVKAYLCLANASLLYMPRGHTGPYSEAQSGLKFPYGISPAIPEF